jgi:hypothetical protein
MISLPHPLNGASGKPITFGTYGSGAAAPFFNGNHIATACFDACAVDGESCVPHSGVPLWSYVTINGFECENTTAIGIGFKQEDSSAPVTMPGSL